MNALFPHNRDEPTLQQDPVLVRLVHKKQTGFGLDESHWISQFLQSFNINILYIIYWTELSAIQEVDSQGKSDTQTDK